MLFKTTTINYIVIISSPQTISCHVQASPWSLDVMAEVSQSYCKLRAAPNICHCHGSTQKGSWHPPMQSPEQVSTYPLVAAGPSAAPVSTDAGFSRTADHLHLHSQAQFSGQPLLPPWLDPVWLLASSVTTVARPPLLPCGVG